MWQASILHSHWLVQKFLSVRFLVWILWYKDHQSHSRTFFGTTCTCEILHSALLSWFIHGTITHSYHWPLNQKYVYAPRHSNGSKSWILIFWMKLHGSSTTPNNRCNTSHTFFAIGKSRMSSIMNPCILMIKWKMEPIYLNILRNPRKWTNN